MNKKFRKFAYSFLALFVFLAIFYVGFCFVLAHFGAQSASLAHFYKTFLLENTKDKKGRIIIDSGSNGLHGISAALIESELNRTAINVADNMTIPLSAKFARLKANIQKDDIIVLPIEYDGLRAGRELTDQFVSGVFFDFGVYWQFLSFKEKLEVISKIRFKTLGDIIKVTKRNFINHKNKKWQNDNYKYITALFNEKNVDFNASSDETLKNWIYYKVLETNGDFSSTKNIEHLGAGEQWCADNCQVCNLSSLQNASISPLIFDFAAYAQKIGAKVLFTYPNIAGKDCYFKDEKLQKGFENFIEKLKIGLKPYDAYYIGDFRDATFDESFIYDSPHHINKIASKERTERLVKYIKEFL